VLVTLRLQLTDGRERQISVEASDVDVTPLELLERSSDGGRVRLGDREECELRCIARVEIVPPPEPRTAPRWVEEGAPGDILLRDEDVETALRERQSKDAR